MPQAEDRSTTLASSTSPSPPPLDRQRPSRRRLFCDFGRAAIGTALAVAVPQALLAGEHPDAELLKVLARFGSLEEEIYPVAGTRCLTIQDEDDRAVQTAPLKAEQAVLVDRACVLRATTLDGLRARAQALLLWDTELPAADAPDSCVDDRMLYALIRDIVGGAVA